MAIGSSEISGAEISGGAGGFTPTAIVDGDSLMEGADAEGSHLDPSLFDGVKYYLNASIVKDVSQGGRLLSTMAAEINTTIAGLNVDWFIFNGGGNDTLLGFATADQVVADVQTIANACIAAGIKVVYMSLNPFEQDSAQPNAAPWNLTKQRRLDEINARIAMWASTTADFYYADCYYPMTETAVVPEYPYQVDRKKLAYCSPYDGYPTPVVDAPGIHFTTAGAQICASRINAVLNGVGSKYPLAPVAAVNTALARYTGAVLTAQETKAITSAVFKLASQGFWEDVYELFLFRLSGGNRAIGAKSKTATPVGSPTHTDKIGYALTPTSHLMTNITMADDPSFLTEGHTLFHYGNTPTTNGVTDIVFGATLGASPSTTYIARCRRTSGSGGTFSVNCDTSQSYAVTTGFALATLLSGAMVAIQRQGVYKPEVPYSDGYMPVRAYIGSSTTTNTTPTVDSTSNMYTAEYATLGVPPPTPVLEINGDNVVTAGTPTPTNRLTFTSTMFGFVNESIPLTRLKRVCDQLEIALAA